MDEFKELEGKGSSLSKIDSLIKLKSKDTQGECLEKKADLDQINSFSEAVEYMLKDPSYFPNHLELFNRLKENYNSSGDGNVFIVWAIDENGRKNHVDLSENIVSYVVSERGSELLYMEAEFIPGLGGR